MTAQAEPTWNNDKQALDDGWEPPTDYAEVYRRWEKGHHFGAPGELTISQAEETHARWRELGKLTNKQRRITMPPLQKNLQGLVY